MSLIQFYIENFAEPINVLDYKAFGAMKYFFVLYGKALFPVTSQTKLASLAEENCQRITIRGIK